MHVLQYIAVESESKKQAFKKVKSDVETLVSQGGFWSDWFVTGGGRWSKNSKDGFSDTEQDVISYIKEKNKFIKAIDWSKEARKDVMKRLIFHLNHGGDASLLISALEYLKKSDSNTWDTNVYNIHKMTELLLGNWGTDSYYYDLEAGSGSYQYIEERIKTNPDSQFLVPVDFHF